MPYPWLEYRVKTSVGLRFFINSYDASVNAQITDSEDVPVFLSTCTRIFEQLATSNAHAAAAAAASAANWASRPMTTAAPTSSMVNCVEAYRVSASGRQLRRMEAAYADRLPTDLEDDGNDSEDNGDGQSMAWSETTATTTTTTAVCEQKLFKLAQLIKRFLRDLPEPVIPTRLYQKTIDLASDTEKSMFLAFRIVISCCVMSSCYGRKGGKKEAFAICFTHRTFFLRELKLHMRFCGRRIAGGRKKHPL